MSNILKGLKKVDGKKTGIFAAGVLFGTAGIKVLSSKDAKKLQFRKMQRTYMQKHSRSTKTEQQKKSRSTQRQ